MPEDCLSRLYRRHFAGLVWGCYQRNRRNSYKVYYTATAIGICLIFVVYNEIFHLYITMLCLLSVFAGKLCLRFSCFDFLLLLLSRHTHARTTERERERERDKLKILTCVTGNKVERLQTSRRIALSQRFLATIASIIT